MCEGEDSNLSGLEKTNRELTGKGEVSSSITKQLKRVDLTLRDDNLITSTLAFYYTSLIYFAFSFF